MKNLKEHILEGLRINKNIKVKKYKYFPQDKDELKGILKEILSKDKNADLNDIDVSNIDNMSYLFYNLFPGNINISKWDVSKVTDMQGMFYECRNFNCDLSNWNVSNVKDMEKIFFNCRTFNCDLSNWDIKKVKTLYKAFYKCESFTYNLENWNTKRKNKNSMFWGCTLLKNRPSWYKE